MVRKNHNREYASLGNQYLSPLTDKGCVFCSSQCFNKIRLSSSKAQLAYKLHVRRDYLMIQKILRQTHCFVSLVWLLHRTKTSRQMHTQIAPGPTLTLGYSVDIAFIFFPLTILGYDSCEFDIRISTPRVIRIQHHSILMQESISVIISNARESYRPTYDIGLEFRKEEKASLW